MIKTLFENKFFGNRKTETCLKNMCMLPFRLMMISPAGFSVIFAQQAHSVLMMALSISLVASMVPMVLSNHTLGRRAKFLKCDGSWLANIYNCIGMLEPYKLLGLKDYQVASLD